MTFKGNATSWNKAALKAKRTHDMIEDMTRKFGDQVLGVHGQELPKFAEGKDTQQYWKNYNFYNKDTKTQSLNRLRQDTKYWSVNDEMLLCDSTGAVPEEDVFKKNRQIIKKSIYAITEKVTDHDVAEKTDKIGDPDWRGNWKPN